MSEENLEIARRGYRAFNEGGVPALRPYLLAEVVWETPTEVPERGIYRGIDAVMAYVEGLSTAFNEVRLEPSEFFAVGEDQVLVVLRLRARTHDDTWIDMPWCHLWTFRDGKASAVRSFLRRDEALQAAGLSDQRDTARAMSEENVERLRAGFEAFNRTGEITTDHLAPDFELHQASSIVDTAGVFRGPDAFHDMLQELQGAFEGLSFEAEEFIEAPGGDIVVFIHARGRGRGSGIEIDNHIAQVWTFRGDKAVRMVAYEEPADALEAAGLSV